MPKCDITIQFDRPEMHAMHEDRLRSGYPGICQAIEYPFAVPRPGQPDVALVFGDVYVETGVLRCRNLRAAFERPIAEGH